jgi:predicted DNA-binding transcriptional regulator YafY
MSDNGKPRIARLTQIITLLQAKQMITAREIAEKFNLSLRTIYRDIKTLEKSGIPIITIEGKGYSIMEGFHLPPITFSENEANALITAEQLIIKNKDKSFTENYQNAVSKIKSTLRFSQKEKTELLENRIYFRNNAENQQTSNNLMIIQKTISNFNIITIEYHSLENKTTKRPVEPFALYSTQDNWLLIAFCHLRNEFRAFRLDRISKLTIENQLFSPHDMTLQDYFEQCEKNN